MRGYPPSRRGSPSTNAIEANAASSARISATSIARGHAGRRAEQQQRRCRRCRAAAPPSCGRRRPARAGCGPGRARPSPARSRRRRSGTQSSPMRPRQRGFLGGQLRPTRLVDIEAVIDERPSSSPAGTVPGSRLVIVANALRAGPGGKPTGYVTKPGRNGRRGSSARRRRRRRPQRTGPEATARAGQGRREGRVEPAGRRRRLVQVAAADRQRRGRKVGDTDAGEHKPKPEGNRSRGSRRRPTGRGGSCLRRSQNNRMPVSLAS